METIAVDFRSFLMAFVPMFVAVDALGVLPMFIALTEGMDKTERKKLLWQSVLTAMITALAFVFIGKTVFHLMGITLYDFMIAGGFLLFLIATSDLIVGAKIARRVDTVGVVPLGVPLIAGPAVLTTALMLIDIHGILITALSIILNILIAGAVLSSIDFWSRLLGRAGSQAVSKIASLLLAAIAVMMIRKGFTAIIQNLSQINR